MAMSPRPRCQSTVRGHDSRIGATTSIWLRRADAPLVDELVADGRAVRVEKDVVQTVSFSGNAFSVKNARGKLRSPRGQRGSVQNVRRWLTTSAMSSAGQRVAERRHVAIERPNRTALVHDRLPVRIGLSRRERAVAEIGRIDVAETLRRPARSVFAVTGQARVPIDVLARSRLGAGVDRQRRRPTSATSSRANGNVSSARAV